MVGFNLRNTLSKHGFVSRGICKLQEGYLVDIDERTNLCELDGLPVFIDENKDIKELDPNAVVSMIFGDFHPIFFPGLSILLRPS